MMSEYNNFEYYTLEELYNYLSDYHKDVHGFRPRVQGLSENKPRMILMIEELNNFLDLKKSTPEGLQELREDGWNV